MTASWSSSKISSVLSEQFLSSSSAPKPLIDILITFDSQGISFHPNHISLYHGAKDFISSLIEVHPDGPGPVDLYTLTTVGFLRKYTGIFDIFAKLGVNLLSNWRDGDEGKICSKRLYPTGLTFFHGLGKGGWATAKEAMTAAHVSQMKWFRYGWIILSRYMFVNDLKLEIPSLSLHRSV